MARGSIARELRGPLPDAAVLPQPVTFGIMLVPDEADACSVWGQYSAGLGERSRSVKPMPGLSGDESVNSTVRQWQVFGLTGKHRHAGYGSAEGLSHSHQRF